MVLRGKADSTLKSGSPRSRYTQSSKNHSRSRCVCAEINRGIYDGSLSCSGRYAAIAFFSAASPTISRSIHHTHIALLR